MKFIGIIPARYASTRFPGKPLIDINGKTMIQRVYEQAQKSKKLATVIVATDDKRIYEHVISFGGLAVMTADSHPSGTDRCLEAAKKIDEKIDDKDVIVNIQGDEPFICPEQIDLLISCFDNPGAEIATLIKEIKQKEELFDPNKPKVVTNINGEAVYFSRSPLPFLRGIEQDDWINQYRYYKHIGIYAYKMNILERITSLSPSALELAEALEQLRWIENGYKIKTEITELESVSIDTPEDLKKIKAE